jgi:LysM repeat protein
MNFAKSSYLSKLALIPIFLFALALSGCLSQSQAKKTVAIDPIKEAYKKNQTNVNSILETAFSQIGRRYRYGGNSPETGFDCSGFVGWVYQQYGVKLPRSSRDMLSVGLPVDREELRPGDLVFFNYGYSHVGIYTGDDKYIHSPRTGKSVEEVNLSDSGRGNRFVGGRRVIDNRGVTMISDNLKDQWMRQSRSQTVTAMNNAAAIKHTGQNQAAPTRTKSSSSKNKPKTAAKPSNSVVHTIIPGDTLVNIAKSYGIKTSDIVAANGIKNKHKLKPGKKLVIPVKASSPTAQKGTQGPKPKKKVN